MLTKPRLRSSFDAHIVGPRVLFLLDEHRQAVLEGEAFPLLLPYLDGRHTLGDIGAVLAGRLTFPQVVAALDRLEKRGYLVDGEATPVTAASPFVEYVRGNRSAEARDLSQTRVTVRTVGSVSRAGIDESLSANNLAVVENGEVVLVVTDDYLRPELEALNREALKESRPWLLVKPVGLTLWIGPFFVPGDTGCWSCLAQRLRANRQTERFILSNTGRPGPILTSRSHLPATVALGYHLAAVQVVEWLLAGTTCVRGKLITIDLTTRQTQTHALVKRPQCSDCGDKSYRQNSPAVPLEFTSRPKQFRGDGGHRTLTPAETYARYEQHVSPILGAVTALTPTMGSLSDLTPSYSAGHNFSMGLDSIVFLRDSIRGMSGGKGITEIQAKVSGLCEALERYSGMWAGDEYTVRGTYADMKPAAIHPNECMGFSDEQFRGRKETNAQAAHSRCTLVPNPFDENLEIDWSPLHSLTHDRVRYLPSAFCYYDHREFRGRWCSPDSNGSAAGNTHEEALLQGFLELVERDAAAIWWYNRIRRRGVDLDSFADPYLSAVRDYYRSLHRELWVLDISSDLPIHTFACVSRRVDRPVEDIMLGFGTHLDPRVALLRAITEVNQFLPSVLMTHADGSTRYIHFTDELSMRWWTTATTANSPYLLPDPGQAPAKASDFTDTSCDDLLDDVGTCVRITRDHDMELLVLDQTRPDIGLSVLKVVVPELCHFWRRFGKKRLYEVPVQMGWRERPTAVEEFNPYSIFF